ncbi:hypothetical protein [Thiocystis violacea]|uniref:hypothetical protein n=1 Tax=Thiocystis violacea TaxID=13725 RepID=UPI001903C560|nr:hypothetical protein [Thiocystis violacea]MBK1716128.1 hypothetical protein [Thiocystis violacea]
MAKPNPHARPGRQTRIDGIEANPRLAPYVPEWAYDTMHPGEALTILPELPDGAYELVLAIDLVEYLERDDAIELVQQLKRVGHRTILSTPKRVEPREVAENPYASHRSQWSEQDLAALGFNKFLPHHAAWIAVQDPDMGPVAQVARQIARRKRAPDSVGRAVPSPAELSRLDAFDIKLELQRIQETLRSVQRQQTVTNDERLSLRHRVRSVMGRFQRRS